MLWIRRAATRTIHLRGDKPISAGAILLNKSVEMHILNLCYIQLTSCDYIEVMDIVSAMHTLDKVFFSSSESVMQSSVSPKVWNFMKGGDCSNGCGAVSVSIIPQSGKAEVCSKCIGWQDAIGDDRGLVVYYGEKSFGLVLARTSMLTCNLKEQLHHVDMSLTSGGDRSFFLEGVWLVASSALAGGESL